MEQGRGFLRGALSLVFDRLKIIRSFPLMHLIWALFWPLSSSSSFSWLGKHMWSVGGCVRQVSLLCEPPHHTHSILLTRTRARVKRDRLGSSLAHSSNWKTDRDNNDMFSRRCLVEAYGGLLKWDSKDCFLSSKFIFKFHLMLHGF